MPEGAVMDAPAADTSAAISTGDTGASTESTGADTGADTGSAEEAGGQQQTTELGTVVKKPLGKIPDSTVCSKIHQSARR